MTQELKIVFYFEMPVCRFSQFPTDTLASHLILYLMPKCDKKKKKKHLIMLSCTCIIILQASLNYMPRHVLLFSILSGTTLLLGILNNERQHSFVWLHSMLCLNSVSSHRSPLPASELYPLQVFQRRALVMLALQCQGCCEAFSVSKNCPHQSK